MFLKTWPPNFWQKTVNPNTKSLDMDTAGKTKADLASEFSAIGMLPTTKVVLKNEGSKYNPIEFGEVPDDATYLRRAAINTGWHKGKTHAFQYK